MKGRTALTDNTLFNVYNATKERLKEAGAEDYGFEARVIMRHVTGFDSKKILMNYNMPLEDGALDSIGEIVKRRAARYPLQYILGEWEFYGLKFAVGEGVLIPRSDTETAVDTALDLVKDVKNPKVLDLCAGSGAIGIAIAANRADGSVLLLEKDEAAAKYLKENIRLNALNNAKYVRGDVLKGDFSDGGYDLIVSNPPYVRTGDLKNLQPEVLFEPAVALDGGEDGLDFYRAIAKNYRGAMNKGGAICFEVGVNQAQSVTAILREAGFAGTGVRKDTGGVDRVVFGTVV